MKQAEGKRGPVAAALAVGFVAAAAAGLLTASQVRSTSSVEFCASCHEMTLFRRTWETGPHGTARMGAIKARCVDCHLPHEGVVGYLAVKTRAGIHDVLAHLTGKKTDWLSKWKNRGPHVHGAYESGCRHCHKDLVVPGIPIKAFSAHRAYRLGETTLHCLDCHQKAGHGDIAAVLQAGGGQG
ncbi:hypothetical protein G3N55_12125, partial [Dissulfurirhabdus thermomarina]